MDDEAGPYVGLAMNRNPSPQLGPALNKQRTQAEQLADNWNANLQYPPRIAVGNYRPGSQRQQDPEVLQSDRFLPAAEAQRTLTVHSGSREIGTKVVKHTNL